MPRFPHLSNESFLVGASILQFSVSQGTAIFFTALGYLKSQAQPSPVRPQHPLQRPLGAGRTSKEASSCWNPNADTTGSHQLTSHLTSGKCRQKASSRNTFPMPRLPPPPPAPTRVPEKGAFPGDIPSSFPRAPHIPGPSGKHLKVWQADGSRVYIQHAKHSREAFQT